MFFCFLRPIFGRKNISRDLFLGVRACVGVLFYMTGGFWRLGGRHPDIQLATVGIRQLLLYFCWAVCLAKHEDLFFFVLHCGYNYCCIVACMPLFAYKVIREILFKFTCVQLLKR